MGTWDAGPFDNHTAREVLAALSDGKFDFDRFKLTCVETPLAVEDAEAVIALGTLAKLPTQRLPEGIRSERVKALRTPQAKAWLRRKINLALDPGHSPAYAMWETTGELDSWVATARAALP